LEDKFLVGAEGKPEKEWKRRGEREIGASLYEREGNVTRTLAEISFPSLNRLTCGKVPEALIFA
jgi:hypothetical protein